MQISRKVTSQSVRIILLVLITAGTGFSYTVEKSGVPAHSAPDCKTVITQMLDSMSNVRAMRFKMKILERIKGQLMNYGSQGKYVKSPRKIYLELNGPEVLWKEGWNNGQALVNPGGFPYFNLNLDPYGSIMREGQHHTIFEIGFTYFEDIIRNAMQRAGNDFNKHIKLVGSATWNGNDCWLVSLEYPEFAFIDYTVRKGDNLLKIAREKRVAEYMILEGNTKMKDFYDVKPGQVIRIPNAYARKTTIMINKKSFLPVNTKIYDNQGLFESYEYHMLQANVNIPDVEFSKEYQGYKF
ncbi:MAG: DUF1571 domain-containing protein [Bacteroidia bacterium]|nr:DUF1571 domain-containing protein [Bacteroidia bacterium]